jgi:hypothetical protein
LQKKNNLLSVFFSKTNFQILFMFKKKRRKKKRMSVRADRGQYSSVGASDDQTIEMDPQGDSKGTARESLIGKKRLCQMVFSNPKWIYLLLGVIIIFLVVLIVYFKNELDILKNIQAQQNADSGQCPVEYIPGLFESLYADWVGEVASHMINARVPCSKDQAQIFVDKLDLNHGAFAGALFEKDSCPVALTTAIFANLSKSAKTIIDASLPCPCSDPKYFAPCDNPSILASAQNDFTLASEQMVMYVQGASGTPYDVDQLRGTWKTVGQTLGGWVLDGRKFGVTSPEFYAKLEACITALRTFGTMLDWTPNDQQSLEKDQQEFVANFYKIQAAKRLKKIELRSAPAR